MYDREVDVPRLVAHYAEPPFPNVLEEIRERVEPLIQVTIQRIGLNFYRDGMTAWRGTTTGSPCSELHRRLRS